MNDPHGFTKENLLSALPVALTNDPKMVALAGAIAALFVQQKEEIGRLSLYPRIGELDEALLDILAYDFKVDWWDNDYTLTEKRRTLQSSWQVHKLLGTKAAVEKAISAIFPRTTVEEWYEYGGKPYHFRLHVDLGEEHLDKEKQGRVLDRVNFYKNLRSHLDNVAYVTRADPIILENHRTMAFLLREAAFDYRFINGIIRDFNTLSGQRKLDGTWILGQEQWGLVMGKVAISLSFQEPVGAQKPLPLVLDFGAYVHNRPRPALSVLSFKSTSQQEGAFGLPGTRFHMAARNHAGFTMGQILDGQWLFDGTGTFNGRRTFDGPVIREIQ